MKKVALPFCLLLALLAVPATAAAKDPGVKHLRYEFGPLKVTPGQNTIDIAPTDLRPKVPGYITRFKPSLVFAGNRKPPSVTTIHLHHGVWLIDGAPTFAVGEEKTIVTLPGRYGFRYTPQQKWAINYMIHNLTRSSARVYITYEIDFVPDTSARAKGKRAVETKWMDVAGMRAYPVFDALREDGRNGRLTFPDDVPDDPRVGPASTWRVTQPTTLVQAFGHLHPGGLSTYITATRGDRTVRLFTSKARYWEPDGAVSWDMALGATRKSWRVALKPGDVVKVHAVYDTSRASWYEVMGIMPLAIRESSTAGKDPFTEKIDKRGRLTHGRLPENRDSGGDASGYPNPAKLPDGPTTTRIEIDDFRYGQGDMLRQGAAGRPPVVAQGQSLTFVNRDAARTIYHTITACKLPCNRSTGIGYPLANGAVDFDSGELGYGPRGFTAAANTDTWSTPADLPAGTYAYFCRVHPFMRGSFRVKG